MASTPADPYMLIERGLKVFPCDQGDKRPVASDPAEHPASEKNPEAYRLKWGTVQSSDPAKIAEWITKYPGCTWGVPTGVDNGFIAVDFDSDEAEEWWDAKWLPSGMEVTTPSGGRHIYWTIDADRGLDIQTNRSKVYKDIDVRAEGGYVVAYTTEHLDAPPIPDSVAEILPERQEYKTEPIPKVEKPARDEQVAPTGIAPSASSPQELRVIKGFTDKLDALPRPWVKGASYHSVQFFVACSLQRAARSPYFSLTMDEARELFLAHAPVRDAAHKGLPLQRWKSALEATEGQWFDQPLGEVPVRLDATDTLDALIQRSPSDRGALESGFFESRSVGHVKTLIQALRMAGATEQEAYSISYEARAMREIRKRSPENSGSTWGWVKSEYEAPIDIPAKAMSDSARFGNSLLTEAERSIIRDYPNFIDDYIEVSKEMFAEPNLPLHYVNAWIALSCSLGDRAAVFIKGKRRPLSLWGFHAAGSASGKGDAKETFKQVVGSAAGWSNVFVGQDASAEEMADILFEKGFQTSLFMQDEAARILTGMNSPGQSYERKFVTSALDWYDGVASRNVRRGMDKSEVGAESHIVFNMWLQTTWENTINLMTQKQVSDGFVGRFIFAIGDEVKITRQSIDPGFKSQYEIAQDGMHPAAEELGRRLREIKVPFTYMMPESSDVVERYIKATVDVVDSVKNHSKCQELKGIVLRLTENSLKAAALLALSEGRDKIAMTDLLLALKSLDYWVRDVIRVVDEISSSEYRRKVDDVVNFISVKPRSRAEILNAPFAKNLPTFEVIDALTRAEQEGRVIKESGKERWGLNQ